MEERLQLLQELDYGDEELLGDDIEKFNEIIKFFYQMITEYPKLEDFFLSLTIQEKKRIQDPEFQECLKNIHVASEKLTDFKTLCEKLEKSNETFNKKIREILENGKLDFDDSFHFRFAYFF